MKTKIQFKMVMSLSLPFQQVVKYRYRGDGSSAFCMNERACQEFLLICVWTFVVGDHNINRGIYLRK